MKKALVALALVLTTPALAQQQPSTVSNMPFASTPLSGGELMYIVQNGGPRKTTLNSLLSLLSGLGGLGYARSGANTDITSLGGGNPWFWFYGPDGSPQAMIGYGWGATQFPMLQGSEFGGSVMCRSNTATYYTDNVNCYFGASNLGSVGIFNGNGTIAQFQGGGASQTDIPIVISAGNGTTTADISFNGGAPTLGLSTAVTFNNFISLYALNANPDFWIDTVNAGGVTTATSGAIVDGWRTTDTQSGKLSFQKILLSTLGQGAATNSTYGEKITVTSGSYSSASTDQFIAFQNLSGGEASSLQWGTSAAQQLDSSYCFYGSGLTVPFNIPISFRNNGSAGTPDLSYVVNFSIPANGGFYCATTLVPGKTTGTWRSSANDNYVGLTVGLDLGSGSNFQAASTGAWVAGNSTASAASSSLVGQATGAYIVVFRSYVRRGASVPYAPLPYEQELAKAQEHFYSTFAPQTAPAQNVGINSGEIQFPAAVFGANSNVVSVSLPGTMKEHFSTSVSTFFNPAAANANCRDETANADGGTVTVLSWTANRITIKCNGNAGTSVGNILGVHMTLDGM